MKSKAKKMIKQLLLDQDLNYVQLSNKMNQNGYKETPDTIRSKVNRGTFSYVFLLEVCDTLNIDIHFSDKNK